MTPKFRQLLYGLSTVATGIVTVMVAVHILDPHTAGGVSSVIAALVGLLGTAATGTATAVVSKQRQEGTLDFQGSAAEQAVAAIQSTVQSAAVAAAELDKVKTAAAEALTRIPAGSLVAQMLNTVT